MLIDTPGGIPLELRREMARRARDKKSRIVERTKEEPCVWTPTEVVQAASGLAFTDITAWHYVADQLEAGCDVMPVQLRTPLGEIGYELLFAGAGGYPSVYVKLRMRKDKIVGRSFHYSTGVSLSK